MTKSPPSIYYRISPAKAEAHLFSVSCTIANPDPEGQLLSLPAWIPGSYMIRDFARNVVTLRAEAGGRPVSLRKIDKQTWQCARCDEALTIAYEVYAWDLSVRSAHLDTTHAYFNGTSVFLKVHGQESEPCKVEICKPAGERYHNWRVATAMKSAGAAPYAFGLYQAANYDELIDHPVEMGEFTLDTFEAGSIPHDIVISGQHRCDRGRLCRDLKKICETHIKMFGELPPVERYLFLVTAVGDAYGGLEHRASTSLLCSRDDLPLAGENKVSEGYRTFLGLCSHEYFHTWNIKRIKPAAFTPYDLSQECYTRQLWAFEGITSYYDDLGLVRSGVIDTLSYLELLGQTITRVWRGQGRFKQSVADSSFDAWSKFYKQDESAPNNIVSYYTKGSLIALALDLTLRRCSENRKTLDDLMRLLWQQYGKSGKGLAENEIEKLASELAGKDLSDFFDRYLYGTEDPPLAELLQDVGIEFHLRPASSVDDKGGKPATSEENKAVTTLGARVVADGCGAKLTHVFDNGPAQQAGLSAGDIVIALNGIKTGKNSLEKSINTYPPQTDIKLHVFRRDELHEFSVTLQQAPADTCYLKAAETASDKQTENRHLWLGQPEKNNDRI